MLQKSGTPTGAQEIWESVVPFGHTETSSGANKRPVIFSLVSVHSGLQSSWVSGPGGLGGARSPQLILLSCHRLRATPGPIDTAALGRDLLGFLAASLMKDNEASQVTWVRS